MNVHFSSNTEEWGTPQALFDNLNAVHDFTLDPCATPENTKCPVFYTKEQNGLIMPWSGRVFMNPPYGRDTTGRWVYRAYEQTKTGKCELVVGLLPARTDTLFFHNWIYGKAEIEFLKGRLKFGNAKNSAPFPSMLVTWRQA